MMQLLRRPAVYSGNPKCSPVERLISLGFFSGYPSYFGLQMRDEGLME